MPIRIGSERATNMLFKESQTKKDKYYLIRYSESIYIGVSIEAYCKHTSRPVDKFPKSSTCQQRIRLLKRWKLKELKKISRRKP